MAPQPNTSVHHDQWCYKYREDFLCNPGRAVQGFQALQISVNKWQASYGKQVMQTECCSCQLSGSPVAY